MIAAFVMATVIVGLTGAGFGVAHVCNELLDRGHPKGALLVFLGAVWLLVFGFASLSAA